MHLALTFWLLFFLRPARSRRSCNKPKLAPAKNKPAARATSAIVLVCLADGRAKYIDASPYNVYGFFNPRRAELGLEANVIMAGTKNVIILSPYFRQNYCLLWQKKFLLSAYYNIGACAYEAIELVKMPSCPIFKFISMRNLYQGQPM